MLIKAFIQMSYKLTKESITCVSGHNLMIADDDIDAQTNDFYEHSALIKLRDKFSRQFE